MENKESFFLTARMSGICCVQPAFLMEKRRVIYSDDMCRRASANQLRSSPRAHELKPPLVLAHAPTDNARAASARLADQNLPTARSDRENGRI